MDAAVGDDRRDERRRRDVERRVVCADAWRCCRYVSDASHFVRRALLDDDLAAGSGRRIHGRCWRGDDERHLVIACRDRKRVRPDLVGDVTIRGDPVRSHDAQVDALLTHQRRGHAVGEHRNGHSRALELPGR